MDLAAALIEAHIYHHTRFPLIDEGIDKIIGYVNFKDIVSALQINPQNPSLRGIVRPIMFVQKEESLTSLLAKLTKTYQHIAVVQDEKNTTIGLVTLEDVIEFMMGEIQDEYESLPTIRYQIAENRFLAGGGVTLSELKKAFNIDLPDSPVTIHEWLFEKMNRIIQVEKTFTCGTAIFIIRKIRGAKIWEVIVDTNLAPAPGCLP
jgi:putative hemolysin